MLRALRKFSNRTVMSRQPPRNPLIAIVGATGTGKSQLAVSLAKRYNGEVINGDAMQLYAGLPVITNKISDEEQEGIPHHLLGCIGLQEQTWVVGIFVKKALQVIDEIRSRGKLPILVGGTHYYTQSLLFLDRLADDGASKDAEKTFVADTSAEWPILQQPTDELLEELRRVDPIMADRWHPNDRRKIQRSLEIYLQSGRKASEIYAEQKAQHVARLSTETPENSGSESSLRFQSLMFWVHADSDALQARLNGRIETMLQSGLLDEVHTLEKFAKQMSENGNTVDRSRGIWVSIGYKEFRDYVNAANPETVNAETLVKMRAEAVERTKIATRQYAKRQLRWINIKLLDALRTANAQQSLFVLDSSDAAAFETTVAGPAYQITECFLLGSPLPSPTSLSPLAEQTLSRSRNHDISAGSEKWVKQHCEVCGVTCVIPEQWQKHIKSKIHRKLLSKSKAQGNGD